MKSVTILIVCLLICLQDNLKFITSAPTDVQRELEPEELQCVNELKLDKEVIEKINNQQYAPEDNEDFNNFISCYWQKMKWENEKGEIDYDALKASVEKIMKKELANKSSDVVEAVNNLIMKSIDYCQKNPPSPGRTNGQTDVKVQNCLIKKLYDALSN